MTTPERKAKLPRRATATSDVTRVRVLAFGALGAAVGCVTALALGPTSIVGVRPRARPHVLAKVACAKCHEEPPDRHERSAKGLREPAFAASAACVACHPAARHESARSAHRALAARGELLCATCHLPHEGAQGVTFEGDAVVRWGAGAEGRRPAAADLTDARRKPTTVPIVPLSACARCHDIGRSSDPVSACVAPAVRRRALDLATTPSLCFDEHRKLESAGSRFVAWEAARDVAASTPWVSAPPEPTGLRGFGGWAPLAGAASGALALGAVGLVLGRRRRAGVVAPPKLQAPTVRKKLPVIDPGTCLGCYACVDACPFDVLTIEKYVAVVARPEECCGVVLCEQVCPNGSLAIAEGEGVLDRPAVTEHLESRDVPGLFLAGDLTGLPLIKNAINQGVQAVDRIAATIGRRGASPIDVLVVGAGPAGLSAALRAREKGLSCVVLEQATVAASIASFPRNKVVYDPPLELPVEGELWLEQATKEELLAQWTRIVRLRDLDVREGRRVTGLSRDGEGFTITASRADGAIETLRAARVVLAIGRRGTPRRLDVAIEPGSEDRVAYGLADARSFAGRRVLVVGLGDSAMEAALALSLQPGTSVSVSYRGAGFSRGKARNVDEMKARVAKGQIRMHFGTVPVAMTPSGAVLSSVEGGRRRTVNVDAMLILIGGDPSWDLLERAGIRRPVS